MKRSLHFFFSLLTLLIFLSACSTKKNTALTRSVQAFKARYNTYFNGNEAFKEGVQAQQDGNKDNYTEVLPLFITGNKATASIGKPQFARAIEKSQKTIKQHSITARPDWPSGKQKDAKDKIWLSQKEYNPFLYRAWFLMGQAQYQQGAYMEAASTFGYIQRLYFSNPDIIARARMWEARCYAALEWFFDAENLIGESRRDSFPSRLEPLRASVLADMQMRQKQWAEAIPNVQKTLKLAGNSLARARLHFLLGQLYHLNQQPALAYKEFARVIRANPPYELEFNARIGQSEVMAQGKGGRQMVRKLQRMARNPKNKEYLDQVYYAIGNIHLAAGDTAQAIAAYSNGVEKSTRNGVEKGVVWLRLGQLYWLKEQFVKAQACYAGVLGLLDKERSDYEEMSERSKILDDLLPFASAVELQDSLQGVARMDSAERLALIDRLIADVKRKEREQERLANEAGNAAGGLNTGAANTAALQNQATAQRPGQTATWYFYNPTAVAAGRTEFQRKWGKRQLADDWRRANKTVLDDDGSTAQQDGTAPADSVATDSIDAGLEGLSEEQLAELERQKEYEQDPHRREFYLKNLPLTPEQLDASNALLVEGLFNAAIIYKDRMENFPLAERTFQRILIDFPDFEQTDEICYNLFQLYSRTGRTDEAADYRQRLIAQYPDNEHAKLVADPLFEYKGRYGRAIEDSLYQEAYDAFQRGDYATVINHSDYTAREYPKEANRPRFMFLETLSRLERGERNAFLSGMRKIVTDYPQSTVSELAGLYVKGLQEGRILASGKMDNGSIWARRAAFGYEADSLAADTLFSPEKLTGFVFVVAYEHDSINVNQLLFEMARYNFTNFAVRSFDISIVPGDGIDMLQIRTFLNYDEAYVYLHRLTNNPEMARKLEGLNTFIISEQNLAKIMKGRSFADYFEYYDRHFDRIPSTVLEQQRHTLDEPTPIPTQDELREQLEQQQQEEDEDNGGDIDYIF